MVLFLDMRESEQPPRVGHFRVVAVIYVPYLKIKFITGEPQNYMEIRGHPMKKLQQSLFSRNTGWHYELMNETLTTKTNDQPQSETTCSIYTAWAGGGSRKPKLANGWNAENTIPLAVSSFQLSFTKRNTISVYAS